MEFLRFIKWQWGQIGRDTKQIGLVVMAGIMSSVYCWFASAGFIGSIVIVIGSIMIMIAIVVAFDETVRAWDKYKRIKEKEAEEIMRKLRGNDGSVTTPGKGFF